MFKIKLVATRVPNWPCKELYATLFDYNGEEVLKYMLYIQNKFKMRYPTNGTCKYFFILQAK